MSFRKFLINLSSTRLVPGSRPFPMSSTQISSGSITGLLLSLSQKKRPMVVGRWTNDLIYSRLAPGVLKRLKDITQKHERMHQHLTEDIGVPELKEHLSGIMALQRAAPNWRVFYSLVERAYPKFRDPPTLPFDG